MTLPDAVKKFGRDRKYIRVEWMRLRHYAYIHEADNAIYVQRGPLQGFGGLTTDDILADDWHVVSENQESDGA